MFQSFVLLLALWPLLSLEYEQYLMPSNYDQEHHDLLLATLPAVESALEVRELVPKCFGYLKDFNLYIIIDFS